jgi:hypothetical protein
MQKDKTEYRTVRLSSGASVRIRPRTYGEWEEQEEARMDMIDGISGNPDAERQSLTLQRAGIVIRNSRLNSWVEGFAGKKGELSLRDVAEIEKFALECEALEIPLGNSETGGDGQ